MATPRNVTTLLQQNFPNDALVRLGDDLYMFNNRTNAYERLVTASSVADSNSILEDILERADRIVFYLAFITEADLDIGDS